MTAEAVGARVVEQLRPAHAEMARAVRVVVLRHSLEDDASVLTADNLDPASDAWFTRTRCHRVNLLDVDPAHYGRWPVVFRLEPDRIADAAAAPWRARRGSRVALS